MSVVHKWIGLFRMNKIVTTLSEIKLVGLTARTNNEAEKEMQTAKIAPTLQKFFDEALQTKIRNRKNPGRVLAVYTNYESDFTGDFTYFLGEEVTSFEEVSANLDTLLIPAQTYAKFTSNPGRMPSLVIDMWQKIWKMTPTELGDRRAYKADFEVYDARSHDPENTIVDVYIGLQTPFSEEGQIS